MQERQPLLRVPFVVVSGLLAAACSGEQLDVGSDQNSSPAVEAPAVLPSEGWPDPASCVVDASAPIGGHWSGYIEGESGKLDIYFTGMDGNAPCGVVVFGDGEPPPPATDAQSLYPPGSGHPGIGYASPWPGMPYTILASSLDGDRLQFGLSFEEVLKSWCPLQTSYSRDDGFPDYGCLPNTGFHHDQATDTCYLDYPDGEEAVSCTQITYCGLNRHACECDADGCIAGRQTSVTFDIHVDGNEAQGGGVFLERVE